MLLQSETASDQIRYQLTIGTRPKFLWFRNAKVGTRTILTLLRQSVLEFELEEGRRISFCADNYLDHFKFAMIRNPWDRFVSGWYDKISQEKQGKRKKAGQRGGVKLTDNQVESFQDIENFARFVATHDPRTLNIHFRPQSLLIDLNAVDYIGRFENFEKEVRLIADELGFAKPDEIPRKNNSGQRKPYQYYISDVTKQMITDYYRKDIQLFGYKFDEDC